MFPQLAHQDTAPCGPAWRLDPVFLAAISFACFLHSTGISISLWPDAALRGFLIDFYGAQLSIQSQSTKNLAEPVSPVNPDPDKEADVKAT